MLQRADGAAATSIHYLAVPAGSDSPKAPAGSRLLLDPSAAPKAGDLCVFRGVDGFLVLELRGATATAWQVRHSNPQQAFDLPRAYYPACEVVIGVLFP